jgi:hypothetical protein
VHVTPSPSPPHYGGEGWGEEAPCFDGEFIEKKPTRAPGEEGLRDIKTIPAIYQTIKSAAAINL